MFTPELKGTQLKGFTIVELLSYVFLSALLLTVMVLFMNSVFKQYVFYSERISLQKVGSLLIGQLERDLEVSAIKGVQSESARTTLIQTFSSTDTNGNLVWANSVIIYRVYSSSKEVKRWVVPADAVTSSALIFSEAHDFTIAEAEGVADPTGSDQVKVWGYVESFRTEEVPDKSMLSVSLELQLLDTKEHQHKHSLVQNLLLRNDGKIS